jgi:glycosyltransferase involved in cell wall biosynthesis
MRVTYVLWGYPVRSEQFVLREIEALERLGVEIDVVVLGPEPPQETPARPPGKIIVRVSGLARARNNTGRACRAVLARPSLAPRLARHLWRTARRGGAVELGRALRTVLPALSLCRGSSGPPDVVHAHFGNAPAVFASLLAALEERPWGVSLHAHDLYAERIDLRSRLAGSRYVLACSNSSASALRDELSGPGMPDVHLLPHGLDLETWQRSAPRRSPRPASLLAAGRFVPKKGFEVLIDACAELSESELDYRCELIGEGPLRGELIRRVRERSLEDRVHIVPWLSQEELRNRLLATALLVVPSVIAEDGDRDNVPNVLVEGLLLGVPVVASDLPAIREVLSPDGVGWMVPPGRSAELATAIRRLCEDPSLATAMGAKARSSVENRFDLRATSKQLLDVLTAARSSPRNERGA